MKTAQKFRKGVPSGEAAARSSAQTPQKKSVSEFQNVKAGKLSLKRGKTKKPTPPPAEPQRELTASEKLDQRCKKKCDHYC